VQKYFMRTRMHGTRTGRPDYMYFSSCSEFAVNLALSERCMD